MKIAVYDVAADSGGALTVLMEYYQRAVDDKQNEYLFIVSTPEFAEADHIHISSHPNVKRSWVRRICFDLMSASKIINQFEPDRVISLQNTTVPFVRQKQIVYMHNPLPKPICDMKFSLVGETKMWIYQNLIGRKIIRSCQKADQVIVQTEWMAKRLVERCSIQEDKITLESPKISRQFERLTDRRDVGKTVFFYPASSVPFKNHEVVVEACRRLKLQDVSDFEIVLTLKGEESKRIAALREASIRENLPIVFAGWIAPESMIDAYGRADCLLFPSKLETWGLPLAEAKACGLYILATDYDYAHETVGGYDRVRYFDPDDSADVASCMLDVMRSCQDSSCLRSGRKKQCQ